MDEKSGNQGSSVTCPSCATAGQTGRFCTNCGARVSPGFCPECGESTQPGERFCAACGHVLGAGDPTSAPAPAAASPRGRLSDAHRMGIPPGPQAAPERNAAIWIVGVLAFVGMVLFFTADLWNGGNDPASPAFQPPAGAGGLGAAPQVDLSSMTPRQAADRLFDRVVRASEAGDSVEVRSFLPMALDAYRIARPMDTDGEFHLTVLQRIANQNDEAMALADSLLAEDPDHLLILLSAAEAARAAGDSARAAGYYRHMLDVYDAERARARQEYMDHSALLPDAPTRAREFIGGGGELPEPASAP